MYFGRFVGLACVVALAGCSSGGGIGATFYNEIPVPNEPAFPYTFQAPSGGPSSATAQFVTGTGVTAFDTTAPDTAGNTVTIATDAYGGLATITVNIGAAGAGPTTGGAISEGAIPGDTFLVNAAGLAGVLAVIAANSPFVLYQSEPAGLVSSAYGVWAVSTAGGYNVGTFAFGNETDAADLATLHAANTQLAYNASTLGFGANGATPFTFSGTTTINANFGAETVSTTISGLTTQNVGGGAGPVIPTLTGSGAITGSTYQMMNLTGGGGTFSGVLNGAFYGPLAAETAGVFKASSPAIQLIGAFGGPHQ